MDEITRRVAALYRGPGGNFWARIEAERPAGYLEENLALGRRQEAALLRRWIARPPAAPPGSSSLPPPPLPRGRQAQPSPPETSTAEDAGGKERGQPEDRGSDLGGRRVLDAGCGRGLLALQLARGGARVLGVDLLPRFSRGALAAARRAPARAPAAGRSAGSEAESPCEGWLSLLVADFRQLLAPAEQAGGFDVILLRQVLQDYPQGDLEELLDGLAAGGARRLLLTLRQATRWGLFTHRLWPEGLGATVDPVTVLRRLHMATPFRLARQEEVRRRNFRSWVGELVRT